MWHYQWLWSDKPFDIMSLLILCKFKLHSHTASSLSHFLHSESLIFMIELVSGCLINLLCTEATWEVKDFPSSFAPSPHSQISDVCLRGVKHCLHTYAPKQFVLIMSTWGGGVGVFKWQNQGGESFFLFLGVERQGK